MDAQGLLRFVNAEAERVFGYPREELLGREVEVLVPEGLFGGRSLDTGLGERAIQGRRKDGSLLSLEVRLSPVSGPEGPSVLAVVRDVSERERYLAKVQRAREEAEMQRSRCRPCWTTRPWESSSRRRTAAGWWPIPSRSNCSGVR
ncbi:PAS domain S-box protein [Myxococcus sp. MxC21-1]|uniref:PAS domain S-box protein n=1 Tax=Myxococcus sp. MxC21-1 TaxID=3041439 RepID=UPI00292DFE19|nr:PAS domain S-box protein [Myxococcus sp. MxC21-1]WNZ62637.1 PAS domain S-box protein [Myxococcus sp. MxC21-1]